MGIRYVIGIAATAAVVLTGCQANDVKTSADTGSAPAQHSSRAAAHLGDKITIKGNDQGSKLTVTLVKVMPTVQPDNEFDGPSKGKRWFGAQFRLQNVGTATYDDSPGNGAKAIDAKSQQFEDAMATGMKGGALLPSDTKLPPGGTALGYVVFEVPKHAKIVKVQFSMDSGFGETGEWLVSS